MYDAYAAELLDYYTHRVDPQTDSPGEDYARAWDREFAMEGHSTCELGLQIQRNLARRDVLELAAGMGRWTRPLLQTANSVLTTDASPRVLPRLRDGAAWGLNLAPGRLRSMKLNAFRPDEAPGMFDGALAVNWFEHMPRELIPEWIRRLHRKLIPGSLVLIAINHLSNRARSRLFTRKDDPNLYAPRYTFDGRRIAIIDNIYSEPDLREVFRPFARDLCYFCGRGHYWITYEPIACTSSRNQATADRRWSSNETYRRDTPHGCPRRDRRRRSRKEQLRPALHALHAVK